jgi:hypothetical protein
MFKSIHRFDQRSVGDISIDRIHRRTIGVQVTVARSENRHRDRSRSEPWKRLQADERVNPLTNNEKTTKLKVDIVRTGQLWRQHPAAWHVFSCRGSTLAVVKVDQRNKLAPLWPSSPSAQSSRIMMLSMAERCQLNAANRSKTSVELTDNKI